MTSVFAVFSAVYDRRACGASAGGGCGSSHPASDRRLVARIVGVVGAVDVFALVLVYLAAVLSEGDVELGGGWRQVAKA